MAENLNYAVSGSKCYGEDGMVYDYDYNELLLSSSEVQANCDTYGRLYDWATAMGLPPNCNDSSCSCSSQIQAKHRGICPTGWHIPSDAEWNALRSAVGIFTSGTKLKAKSGWYNNGNGTDEYGFSALPGGRGSIAGPGGSFRYAGYEGYWWSASQYSEEQYGCDDTRAYYHGMGYNYDGGWGRGPKCLNHSVRCLKD
jgi:uncharacterized protein (TIGR02145 family)